MEIITEQTFTGKIIRRELGRGAKAKRMINALMTDDHREYILRREGKDPFVDIELEALEGKMVKATGTVSSYVLVVRSFELT